jgi:hypothetical protein
LIDPRLSEITKVLNNKVWFLEQLILKNIHRYEFNYIKEKIIPKMQCDGALTNIFNQINLTEGKCIEGLLSNINDLRKKTGNLLHPYPDEL